MPTWNNENNLCSKKNVPVSPLLTLLLASCFFYFFSVTVISDSHVWDCMSKSIEIPIWCFFASLWGLGCTNTIEPQAIKVCWPWSTTPKRSEEKNAYIFNKNINLPLRNFPVAILIKPTQKSILPSNHTFVIMLIGCVWASMSVPN